MLFAERKEGGHHRGWPRQREKISWQWKGVGVHETAIDGDSDWSTKMGRFEMSCGTKRKRVGWAEGRMERKGKEEQTDGKEAREYKSG